MELEALILPLKIDDSLFKAGLDKAKGLASGFANAVGTASKIGFGIAAAGVTALAGAAAAGISQVNDFANELDTFGDQLGTTAEQGSTFAVMLKEIGMSDESFAKSLVFMGKGLVNAKGEIGTTGKALQKLGINLKNSNGTLKSSNDLFREVADRIGNMPDGIEKTNAMMEIFGKSGKDMGDALAAAADGGLQNYTDKAKALGLVLSDEAVAGSISLQKSFQDLKMVGQGLFVTLGNELLPIIAPLAQEFLNWAIGVMPQVRDIIHDIVENKLKPFIEFMGKLKDAFMVMGGDILLGLSNVAYFMGFDALGDALANLHDYLAETFIPKLGELKTWLDNNLPIAIDWLKQQWENVLYPALVDLWNYLTTTVIPKLSEWADWLKVNIPAAIDTLKEKITQLKAWYDQLTPSQQNMVKTLGEIAAGLILIGVVAPGVYTFFGTLIGLTWKAVVALTAFWITGLIPVIEGLAAVGLLGIPVISQIAGIGAVALAAVRGLVPLGLALTSISTMLGGLVGSMAIVAAVFAAAAAWLVLPFVIGAAELKLFGKSYDDVIKVLIDGWNWLKASFIDQVVPAIAGAFNSVKRAIENVIGSLREFYNWLTSISLPWWLTPGSPTPLELGLKGIDKALKGIDFSGFDMNMASTAEFASPVNVNIEYRPMFSLADQYEAENVIKPLVEGIVRKL